MSCRPRRRIRFAARGSGYFAVDGGAGDELVGMFVLKLSGAVAEIGLGLRPDLTGRGLALPFVEAGLRFAAEALGATSYSLGVAGYSERAFAVYRRAGSRKPSATCTPRTARCTTSSA